MPEPDSLLSAAKAVAEVAGMRWSDVQPYYRALQPAGRYDEGGWLPKSAGRRIWYAKPEYVARLLIALAVAQHPGGAMDAVTWVYDATRNGRKDHIEDRPAANIRPPVERELCKFLVDPDLAKQLSTVEFQPDCYFVVFKLKGGEEIVFSAADTPAEEADLRNSRGILSRGVIKGLVFEALANRVKWRTLDQPPFKNGSPDDAAVDSGE